MVLLLVLITAVIAISLSFFIQRKKRLQTSDGSDYNTLSLGKIIHMLPVGVFLQPTFTWSKILDTGNVMIGIQPILTGLVGQADEIEMPANDSSVKAGDTLFKIHREGKILNIKSPVEGKIISVNTIMLDTPNWKNLSQNWLCSIKPQNVSSEIPNWLLAEKSKDWTTKTYQKIKDFLIQTSSSPTVGATLADGGDIPIGIFAELNKDTWNRFETHFTS